MLPGVILFLLGHAVVFEGLAIESDVLALELLELFGL